MEINVLSNISPRCTLVPLLTLGSPDNPVNQCNKSIPNSNRNLEKPHRFLSNLTLTCNCCLQRFYKTGIKTFIFTTRMIFNFLFVLSLLASIFFFKFNDDSIRVHDSTKIFFVSVYVVNWISTKWRRLLSPMFASWIVLLFARYCDSL